MRQKSLLSILALLFFCSAVGQNRIYTQKSIDISFKVKDSLSGKGLEFVTASLFKVKDEKTVYTYSISDSSGLVKFINIPSGKYSIILEYLGYYSKKISNLEVAAKVDGGNVSLYSTFPNKVVMRENPRELNAAILTDKTTPIKRVGDTLIYNVASFKVSDNDMLEDFFKKLPGWSVNRDGKITVNGKPIDQITVNGRVFFVNDPVFVSKNLPAKIMQQIKLFEKKSEKSAFLGSHDDNPKQTVDVKIRDDMMKGWVGNVTAGAGSEDRFKSKAFVANFDKFKQIAIIGNGSNVNDESRSFSTTFPQKNSNYSLGSNLNLRNKKGNILSDISYKFSGNNITNETNINKLNTLKDTSFIIDQNTKNNQVRNSHNVDAKVTKTSAKSMSIFKAAASYSNLMSDNDNQYRTIGGKTGIPIIDGEQRSSDKNLTESVDLSYDYIRKLKKTNRSFSIKTSLRVNDRESDGFNYSKKTIHKENNSYITDQKNTSNLNNYSFSADFSYNEPIFKKYKLVTEFKNNLNFGKLQKKTYDKDINGNYSIIDQEMSADLNSTTYKSNIGLFIENNMSKSGFILKGGFNISGEYIGASLKNNNINRSFFSIDPSFQLRVKIVGLTLLYVNYKGYNVSPNLNSLIPMPDNRNPLVLALGNPDLKPSYINDLSVKLNIINNNGYASGIIISGSLNMISNNIISKSWFDDKGVQYIMPMNESGDYSAKANMVFDYPIFNELMTIKGSITSELSTMKTYVNNQKGETKIANNYFSFGLGYRSVNTSVQAGVSFNNDCRESSFNRGIFNTTWKNSADLYFRTVLPLDVDFNSDISYNFFTGYVGGNTNIALWNAKISRNIIRNKLLFTINANDILNQNKSIYRKVSDFYIEERRSSIVGRHILFSLTYKFMIGGKSGAFREKADNILQRNEQMEKLPISL